MRTLIIMLSFFASTSSLAATSLTVKVLDVEGNPVPNVVVYAEPESSVSSPEAMPEKAVMDQVNKQFQPHILVVQKGADVYFPNSDSIKHHVYSFSPPKTFELKLYKGESADPVTFDKEGEVELGCNVHDWMLGYIYVVDTPYFGKTNDKGDMTMSVPEGTYQLNAWHPLMQESQGHPTTSIQLPDVKAHTFRLKASMLDGTDGYESLEDEFGDYE